MLPGRNDVTDDAIDAQEAARMVDRGDDWKRADHMSGLPFDQFGDALRQALHDRDRFQRERDYWREQAETAQTVTRELSADLEGTLEALVKDCVEIGAQTYYRKPAEMLETTQAWKLARAEKIVRGMRQRLEKLQGALEAA